MVGASSKVYSFGALFYPAGNVGLVLLYDNVTYEHYGALLLEKLISGATNT